VAEVTVPMPPPGGLGDFLFEVAVAGANPVRVPVHVTGRRAEEIDYRRVYAAADLSRDYWTVVGPQTREEFDRLGRVKLELLVRVGLTPGSRLLDVGCGTGQLAAVVEGFLADDGAYHGTDVAEEAVRFGRARYRRPNFTFSVGDLDRLEIAGRGFDVAAFFSVFTHTFPAETAALLREVAALLVPGGVAFADFFASPMVRDHAGHRGAVEVNPDRLSGLIAAAGLTTEEVQAAPWGRFGRRVFLKMVRR
jgi:SAM-dependent methyltransferase